MPGQHRVGGCGGPPIDPRIAPVGETLTARRDRPQARLEAGWTRIARVEADGGDSESRTDFWIALLREYERVCDRLADDEAGGARGDPT